MSSAYKTLKTSDITVAPYRAYKTYTVSNVDYSNYGIERFSDSNTPTSPDYPYYRSIRQLYYSYNRTNLATTIPLSEQSITQLQDDQNNLTKTATILAYDNYLQATAASGTLEYDNREQFPTASGEQIAVISIPQEMFGEQIKPGSFNFNNVLLNLTDDGNGNIIDPTYTYTNIHLGTIIYSHGIVILTDQNAISDYTSEYAWTLSFASTLTIYENQFRCHVNENEFNATLNPSALSGSTGIYNNNVTGSDFDPYVTTVGLYSAASELLAIGKLAQPYPVPSNTDITFVIRYDS